MESKDEIVVTYSVAILADKEDPEVNIEAEKLLMAEFIQQINFLGNPVKYEDE